MKFVHVCRCTKYCNLPTGTPIFSRFESDDSPAIYASVIRQTTSCKTTAEYLDLCWKELFLGQCPLNCNHHLCRTHAMDMFVKALERTQYGLTDTDHTRLKDLFRLYLESRTMREVVFYVRKLFILLLSSNVNDELLSVMATSSQPMPSSFTIRKTSDLSTRRCIVQQDFQ